MKLIPLIKKAITLYQKTNVAVKASIWFTFCSIFQKGISVITMPIFTRLMTTEQYGTYNIFLTWYNILLLVITLNIHSEIFNKGLITHKSSMDEFMSNQIGLLLTLFGGFFLVYIVFKDFWNSLFDMSTGLMLVMLLEILASGIMGMWYARKRFDYDYVKIVKMTVFTSLAVPILGIVMVVLTDKKAEAKIISNALVPVVISCVIILIYSRRGKFFSNTATWKISLLAALPLVPHYLSLVLLNQSDKLMINHFIGKEAAAIYSVAHSAGLLMTIINGSINGSFVPWAYRKLEEKQETQIKLIATPLLFIVMVVNVGLIWIAPESIKLLAASQYAEATLCLVPIAMSVYFYFVYTLFVDVEIYFGRNELVAIASVCATVMNLVLNYICIPKYGYIAAGYTTLFSYFATMVLHCIFLYYVLKKRNIQLSQVFDLRMVSLIGLCLVLLSTLAVFLYNYSIFRYGILAICIVALVWNRSKVINAYRLLRGGKF